MPRRAGCCCGRGCATLVVTFLVLSVIPLAIVVAFERTTFANPSTYRYRSNGLLRESIGWDEDNRRFLVSTCLQGGLAEIEEPSMVEKQVVKDKDVRGNVSLGVTVDRIRRRVLVVYSDVIGGRYGAVGAYDLRSWKRIFLTKLSGQEDEQSLADDVTVDTNGNAYITDAKANKIWKVGVEGQLLSTIRNKAFKQNKEWYNNLVGLNGIVYHPDGFLLVIHTSSGALFRVDVVTEEVVSVVVAGQLQMGDGLELVSPTELVMAGMPSTRMLVSSDGWSTAKVTARYVGPVHRIPTAAAVKDGKVYVNYVLGGGFLGRTHVISEALFSPSSEV